MGDLITAFENSFVRSRIIYDNIPTPHLNDKVWDFVSNVVDELQKLINECVGIPTFWVGSKWGEDRFVHLSS